VNGKDASVWDLFYIVEVFTSKKTVEDLYFMRLQIQHNKNLFNERRKEHIIDKLIH